MPRLVALIQVLIGLTFLIPIIVGPEYLIHAYSVPRVLTLRVIVELMLGAYIVLAVGCWNRFGIRLSPITIAVLCMWLSTLISTWVGVDWRRSLFDTYERMFGVDTVAHYVAFYLIATTIVKRWATWQTLLRLLLGVAVIVSAVGVVQKFDQVFVSGAQVWISATLGNSSFLGQLSGFTACLAVLLALRDDNKSWRLEYGVAGVLGLVGVAISESRGALLSVLAGLGILLVCYYIVLEPGHKLRRLCAAGVGAGALLALLMVAVWSQSRIAYQLSETVTQDQASLLMKWADATNPRVLGDDQTRPGYVALLQEIRSLDEDAAKATLENLNAYIDKQGSALDRLTLKDLRKIRPAHLTIGNRERPVRTDRRTEHRLAQARRVADIVAFVPGLRRFVEGSTWQPGPLGTGRFTAWRGAMDAFEQRPVFGWGPNNFSYAFSQLGHFGPDQTESWYDDAHNVFLNTLCEQGALGALIYLALMATPVAVLWRAYRRGATDVHLAAVGTAFITMHAVQNLFVFENPSSYLSLMVMLALFNSQTQNEKVLATGSFRWRPVPALASVALVLFLLWANNLRTASALANWSKVARQVVTGNADDLDQALDHSEQPPALVADGPRRMFAQAVLVRLTLQAMTVKRGESDISDANISATAVRIAEDLDPLGWSKARQRLRALQRRKGMPSNPGGDAPLETKLHALAVFAFGELAEEAKLHPLDVGLPLQRARIALQLAFQFDDRARVAEVEPELERALQSNPARTDVKYVLSAVKLRLSKPEQAIALLEAVTTRSQRHRGGWWRLAQVYEAIGQAEPMQAVARQANLYGVADVLASELNADQDRDQRTQSQ